MKKLYYEAYGLHLISDVKIDAFQEVDQFSSATDCIEIKQSIIDFEGYSFIDDFVIREYTDSGFLYVIKDIVAFLVKGSSLKVQPLIKDSKVWQSFLVGGAMSILLIQKNYFLLHGSAIEFNKSAYLFLGLSGAGKSSLAAALGQKKYNIITDDICAISRQENDMYINIGTKQVRLMRDTVEALKIENANYIEHPNAHPKFGYNPSRKSREFKTKIKRVIELVVDENMTKDVVIEKVNTFQSIELLRANIYKAELANTLRSGESQSFQFITYLAKEIEFYKIKRKRRKFKLRELVSFIEENVIHP